MGRNWPGTNLGPFRAQAPGDPLSEHPDNLGWLSSTPTAAAYWQPPSPISVQSTGQMESPHPTSQAPPTPPTRVPNSKNSTNIQMVTYEMLSRIFLPQRAAAPPPAPTSPEQFLCQDEEEAPGCRGPWP